MALCFWRLVGSLAVVQDQAVAFETAVVQHAVVVHPEPKQARKQNSTGRTCGINSILVMYYFWVVETNGRWQRSESVLFLVKSLSDIPESLQYLQRRHGQQLSRCAFSLIHALGQQAKTWPFSKPTRVWAEQTLSETQACRPLSDPLRIDGCFVTLTWYSYGVLSSVTCFKSLVK